ncbi:MAG TPA: HDOD domain-containing protein [Deferrisomatales bacterium]|nr:HDOD domain-containing protein [Deferrisomatales bacterium]
MTPEEMVSGVSELVSLPEVCVRINEMLDDPSTTSKALGEVISHDPNLTARLLRLVNSAYYGMAAEINTVSHAVTIVGLDELRSLVLATSASRAFANIPTEWVDMDTFWHHSVYCGLVARVLGAVRGMRQRERLFVIGLLHDVGRLVLYHQAPAVARQILESAGARGRQPTALEKELLGFTHAEIGAALLRTWRLPSSLWQPVECHHEPMRAEEFRAETLLLHVANAIAVTVEPGTKGQWNETEVRREVDPQAWDAAGLDEDAVQHAITEANLRSLEVLAIVAPDAALIF